MQIFLDEQCFVSYFRDTTEGLSSIQSMIDLMELIVDATQLELFVPENFYSFDVDGVTVGEIIYAHYADPILRDVIRQFEYIVNGAGLVPENTEHGPTAVAGLRSAECGGLLTNWNYEDADWWNAVRMYRLTSWVELRSSVRIFFVVEKLPEAELSNYSGIMFDSLYFHCPLDDIKTVGLKYFNSIGDIVKHLAYLNDRVLLDFQESSDDRELTTRAGSQGVNMTPESHATRTNRAAMQQREVTVLGVPITCEWHTKLTPTQGRIHFYPWATRHSEFGKLIGQKVIIGIICKHLD